MANVPTADESARYILSVYLQHNCRSGDVLRDNVFAGAFAKDGWQASDYNAGMPYAIEQGWIEPVSKSSFRLTEAGFAAA